MSDLGTYDGRDILGMSLIMRKTGDGLSKAVKVEPRKIKVGDKVYVIYEAECVDVHHPAEKRHDPGFGGVYEVPVLDAGVATIVDADVVLGMIDAQAERNTRWEAEQAGQAELRDDALIKEHDAGLHADPVEHCPRCIAIADHEAGKHKRLRPEGQCALCDQERELAAQEKAESDTEATVTDIGDAKGRGA